MKQIRVVIADDSSLARALLRSFLEAEEGIEIVGEARNGREAVDLVNELRPDLLTIDLEMPVMSGMEAIEEIMCSKAVPILVVSSVANAHNALVAVGQGALEVVSKPDCTPEQAADFVAKVRLLAGVSVITRRRPRKTGPAGLAAPAMPPSSPSIFEPQLLSTRPGASASGYARVFAIASSTGGPQALAKILSELPAAFPCPVLIAQHIAEGFSGGMAEWLGRLCRLPVRLAAEGDLLEPGVIYVAPSEFQGSITSMRRIALVERGPLDIYHPSCDVLLNSVADVFADAAVGIILTGMSSDGAKGIARIREKGGVTLAQDEATSVIYGMNRVAIEAGSVHQVLPVEAIAHAMGRLAEPVRRSALAGGAA